MCYAVLGWGGVVWCGVVLNALVQETVHIIVSWTELISLFCYIVFALFEETLHSFSLFFPPGIWLRPSTFR